MVGDEGVTIVHDPGGIGFRIERLWAYIAVHDDGDEGIVGLNGMPLIGADQERVISLRPHAEKLARLTGKEIRLVRFDHMTVVERFVGGGGSGDGAV